MITEKGYKLIYYWGLLCTSFLFLCSEKNHWLQYMTCQPLHVLLLAACVEEMAFFAFDGAALNVLNSDGK